MLDSKNDYSSNPNIWEAIEVPVIFESVICGYVILRHAKHQHSLSLFEKRATLSP
jgi:hypothetical protein